MSGNSKRFLIDSNIFIYHFKGNEEATNFLLAYVKESCLSIITYMEILSLELSPYECNLIKRYLENFQIIYTDFTIARQVVFNKEFEKTYQSIFNPRLKKIRLPDNIVLSTAQVYNLTLVTSNIDDFRKFNVDLLNPLSSHNKENYFFKDLKRQHKRTTALV
ncbi:PIN domain-containing protein [Desulfonauticus submarinus]|uniref:PIN domain-containing protein n=1 Tax=Desulfonauticus submarinus TaxID=206665 RepID=A0A1H0E032_9BACT|nr:type II toxin-antitoxin system VapC family toxin [Desulfonauticus submarinus]SDN75752.1 PIN domain-containing protein [Desulfonauticus submarinus]